MATISGVQAFAQYGFEGTFKTKSSDTNYKVFGHGLTASKNSSNNPTYIFGIGSKNAQANTPGVFAGTGTVSGALSDPWMLEFFFGDPANAGAGPYTHTYTEGTPVTFSTEMGMELGATDSQINLLGCIAQNLELSATVGDPIGFTLNFVYADEEESSSLSTQKSTTYARPFFFQEGSISIGGTLAPIQDFKITIEQNPIAVNKVGSRITDTVTYGQRTYAFAFTRGYADDDELEAFYGGTTPASSVTDDYLGPVQSSATLTFNNGEAGTAQRQLVITLANLFYDEHNLEMTSDALINEEISGQAISMTSAVATDNTATVPA